LVKLCFSTVAEEMVSGTQIFIVGLFCHRKRWLRKIDGFLVRDI